MRELVGQWIGRISGELNKGSLVVNLELEPEGLVGSATYLDEEPSLGAMFAERLHLIPGQGNASGTAKVAPIARNGTFFPDIDSAQASYPRTLFPDTVTVSAQVVEGGLGIALRTSLGQEMSGVLKSYEPPKKSQYQREPSVRSWASFKEKVSGLEPRRYIFRGQPQPWPLQTLFHRKRRKDVNRYVKEDIPKLTELITPHITKKIDIRNPDELATLYSIAQHHGYPTPMLDWTWSPFIAAFFAFRIRPERPNPNSVRIFAFDQILWRQCSKEPAYFLSSIPMLEVISAAPLDNNRLVPQQSVFTLTNLWDVEGFIRWNEKRCGEKFLHCFDLPLSERSNALHELSVMGVTAASMFPGLDGTCEALRGRMFGDLTEVPQSRL
ncbi:hypothetical protein GCM10011367_22730 [Marinicauda pacifica]|uniref:FRG domain-containing protein n=1 Tax=Marinicauda pacifica TaxID=1133559 RepID=A0A4S2H9L4_9PROT|nr:FRG domain-containing protein [Marinicauda pacifica]TGY92261.1 FRG domain-containing protein [Marinicauda pacifica]GGE47414.1 hypothetical protein GCM10011367_22730 [Marinicauda pacifica]